MLDQLSPRRMAIGAMVLCLGLPLALGTVNSAQSSPTSLGLLAQASRWVEVGLFSGRVTYRGREQRAARSGDRLLTGQGLATARRATAVLEIDDNIGVVRVAEQTDLAVTQLGVLPDGARVTRFTVNRGQARVQARPFTNPNSLLEVTTPSGVVSVRGTEYGLSVAADGKTAVATLEGVVAATAAGQSVNVEAGFATVIRPGEPPLAPFALDRELDLRLSHQRRGSRQLNLEGYVNPANSVLINGQEIPVNRRGFFSTHLTVPANQAFLTVIVRNPLGEERRHRLSIREVDDN